ncbi:MAG: hypothetical protein JST31_08270 [Actinobacteria bacterium]|nr:hypothetical protein [Actinomycetota bacterium]
MSRLPVGRPSAAMAVALVALVAAISGTAWAATQIDGRTIAKNSEPGNRIKQRSLPANRLKPHSLTGAEINLGGLGTVPAASHAATADHAATAEQAGSAALAGEAAKIGGLSVLKFSRTGAVPSASPVTLANVGGLKLTYSCLPSFPDTLIFAAVTTVNGAELWLTRTAAGGASIELQQPFNVGETFLLTGFVATGVYTAPDGQVVTFTYRNTLHCAEGVAGTAVGG